MLSLHLKRSLPRQVWRTHAFFSTQSYQFPDLPLFKRALTFRENIAIQSNNKAYNYAEVLTDAHYLKNLLLSGNRTDIQGERVAFMCHPSFEYTVAQWGIWSAGGVAVPLFPQYPPQELEYLIQDSQATFIVGQSSFSSLLKPLAEKNKVKYIELPNFGTTSGTELSEAIPTHTSSSSSLTRAVELNPQWFNLDKSRNAMLIYTSGTTGKPKGVVSTHAIIESQITPLVEAWEYTEEDHLVHVLPLHHMHGIMNILLCPLWAGAKITFPFQSFDVNKLWKSWETLEDLTVFSAVPTIYSRLISAFDSADEATKRNMQESCRKFRLMMSGSAALPESVMHRWEEISGHKLLERYGMTELAMVLSNPLHGERRAGTVGFPLPRCQMKIVPERGESKREEKGLVGELYVKGPNVFKEYWNRPDATKETFSADGWFKTGDIATIDDDGYYKIVGRASVDIIKSSGYKISALDIERELLLHPVIHEVAVVGIPSEEYGQIIGAIVGLKSGANLTLDELRAWCKDRLAAYKHPRKLIVLKEIPRNALGKTNKKELVKLFK